MPNVILTKYNSTDHSVK